MSMLRPIFVVTVALATLVSGAAVALAADKTAVGRSSAGASESSSLDESGVDSPGVELARRHLKELLPLLAHLRAYEPEQFEKAIRELDRAAKRLESQQRRGADFYDKSLQQWQSRGRIDLLKARLRVRPTESDRKALLAEMQRLRKVEIERLQLEVDAVSERQRMLALRVAQAEAASLRAGEQIDELNQNIERLAAQRIDGDWPVYRRAAGLDREPEATKKTTKPTTNQTNN